MKYDFFFQKFDFLGKVLTVFFILIVFCKVFNLSQDKHTLGEGGWSGQGYIFSILFGEQI